MPTTWNSVLTRASMRVEQLEQQAHERSEHEHRDGGGDPPVDALALPEEVHEEGGDGGDGAVGEVEDAGGLVGEHEPRAREAVDGPGGETDDDERKQVVHAVDTPHFRCRPTSNLTVALARSLGSDAPGTRRTPYSRPTDGRASAPPAGSRMARTIPLASGG